LRSLNFWDGTNEFNCDYVTQLDISFFSLKNQYTGELGNTFIYPIKNRKTRILFTAEVQGDYEEKHELSTLMHILNQPEFECDFRYPEYDWIPNGDGNKAFEDIINLKVCVTSDISVTKIISENGIEGGLYAVSATLEEV